MQALLEKTRNHHKHPVMSSDERASRFGGHEPRILRAHRTLVPSIPRLAAPGQPLADDQEPRRWSDDALDTEDNQQADVAGAGASVPPANWQRRTSRRSDDRRNRQEYRETTGAFPSRRRWGRSMLVRWGLMILGSLALAYTMVYLALIIWISTTNLVQYGPVHTSYTHTQIQGNATTIITGNDHGHITITIRIEHQDGSVQFQTIAGPEANPATMNGDLDAMVATATLGKDGKTITITLTGQLSYFHPFARPVATFLLEFDKQGYKVAM